MINDCFPKNGKQILSFFLGTVDSTFLFMKILSRNIPRHRSIKLSGNLFFLKISLRNLTSAWKLFQQCSACSPSQNLYLAMHDGQGREVNIYFYIFSIHSRVLFSYDISINVIKEIQIEKYIDYKTTDKQFNR